MTVDCADPGRLAAFWAALLGTSVAQEWEQYVVLRPVAGQPALSFQRVPARAPGPGVLHLDLHAADDGEAAATVSRAVELGGRVVGPVGEGGARWTVLDDPEGNRFCVVVGSRLTASADDDPGVPSRWTRAVRYGDMWLDPADDPRERGPWHDGAVPGEREVLTEYLRRYRLTLELKCADLDAAALARRSVPPSTMSLLGLVRHMADVERGWFRRVLAGEDAPPLFFSDADREGDWHGAVADDEVVAVAWRAWRDEVAFAERLVAATPDLGTPGRGRSGSTVREVLVHMIEEYARHCGHADLLRERVDGRTGQ